ncbi:MAG: hypothetical protein NAG76_15430 [Candidatus Pristimantibacillus lignocellulolyticus]|uniref:Uncharacterized protein n=1 Tax=Candidatus Pristimantibacillus lignocellulolyticus TaxID=2994561 RepID=A0A9J6ZBJ7_9BACL|nr:MAG: hypothetical protein NAG76_15430 [Candidatus Pristimantibacillus lignocellulolyticus]
MIVREDLTPPNQEDFGTEQQIHAEYKANMIRLYGDDAFISLDFEGVCEAYEPVNIEITQKLSEYAKSFWEE